MLALVGGRNYGMSQLDHAVAKRPTGSIFKPFVYAAAVNTAVNGGDDSGAVCCRATEHHHDHRRGVHSGNAARRLAGEHRVWRQVYEPRNYHDSFKGEVTARYALAMSLNNATVRLAQEVGFDKVASLAKAAGISSVHATPCDRAGLL